MKSSSKNKRIMSICLFMLIAAFITLYLFFSFTTFLTYQWFINMDFNTVRTIYDYDAASVAWFSVLSAIILTTVLYKPLSHSIWFKPLWDKLEQESKERE